MSWLSPSAWFYWLVGLCFKASIFSGVCLIGVIYMLRHKAIVPYLLLPAVSVSQQYADRHKQERDAYKHVNSEFVRIPVGVDGDINLDAVVWLNKGAKNSSRGEGHPRWILWLNTNGVCLEDNLRFLERYSEDSGSNVLSFNYRGVGMSSGTPSSGSDLVQDGMAAMNYLKVKHGAGSLDILIHGHSIGGAVAAAVRAGHPDGPIIHDRSFSNMLRAAEGVIDAIGGMIHRQLKVPLNQWDFIPPLEKSIADIYDAARSKLGMASANTGSGAESWLRYILRRYVLPGESYFPTAWRYFTPVLMSLLWAMGWELDATKPWARITGRKVVVFHAADGMIPFKTAALYNAVGGPRAFAGCHFGGFTKTGEAIRDPLPTDGGQIAIELLHGNDPQFAHM